MSGHWQKFAWVGAGATLGVALSLAITVDAQKDVRSAIPIEELRAFAEVYARIKSDYVEPISDKKLMEQAIGGLLSGLDPHSAYLDEQSFKDLRTATTGKFGGIGIEIGVEDGYIKVVTPIDDTPATRAGIRAGDLITKVDGESTRGLSTSKAVERMRGTPGTNVRLELFRKDERSTQSVSLTRELIKIQGVKAKPIEPGFAFIRVTTFSETTVPDVVKALTEQNALSPLKGVVLDLRNNPGGLLDAAVGLSAVFLPKDVLVVYADGRIEGSRQRYLANKDFYSRRGVDALAALPEIIKTVPLVVLINGGSASASEIVAGALQDHKRATVIGTTTFGKGSVQSTANLTPNTGYKLTTSRYFTPNGRSIQGTGIDPEIVVDQLTTDGVMLPKFQREKDLSRHLVGKDETKDVLPDEDFSEDAQEAKSMKVREDNKKLKDFEYGKGKDYLYLQAINKLKGLPVVRSTVEAVGTTAKAVVPSAEPMK
jgi:carboxyl-terminal processing protease